MVGLEEKILGIAARHVDLVGLACVDNHQPEGAPLHNLIGHLGDRPACALDGWNRWQAVLRAQPVARNQQGRLQALAFQVDQVSRDDIVAADQQSFVIQLQPIHLQVSIGFELAGVSSLELEGVQESPLGLDGHYCVIVKGCDPDLVLGIVRVVVGDIFRKSHNKLQTSAAPAGNGGTFWKRRRIELLTEKENTE